MKRASASSAFSFESTRISPTNSSSVMPFPILLFLPDPRPSSINEYILDSRESSRSDDPDIGGNQYNDVVNGGDGSDDSETRKASSRNTTCSHSGRFSCLRTITSLAPIARVRMASYSAFQEAVSDFLSGLTENHVLESFDLFIEGKASGRDSMNFLRPQWHTAPSLFSSILPTSCTLGLQG